MIKKSDWKCMEEIEDIIEEYHEGNHDAYESIKHIYTILKNYGWIKEGE